MDEQQAHRFSWSFFQPERQRKEYELRRHRLRDGDASVRRVHPGPGKGEGVPGAYPTPPSIQLRRVLVRDGLWVRWGTMTTAPVKYLRWCNHIEPPLGMGRCGATPDATTPSRLRRRSGGLRLGRAEGAASRAQTELRRIPLPRTLVNRGKKNGGDSPRPTPQVYSLSDTSTPPRLRLLTRNH